MWTQGQDWLSNPWPIRACLRPWFVSFLSVSLDLGQQLLMILRFNCSARIVPII